MRPDLSVSVVIVTYRRPAELGACLDALAAQSRGPKEIIVVDNAAPGDSKTRAVCDARSGIYPVRYVPSPFNSLPVGRNLGVSLCSGDLVALVDDDVRIANDYLQVVAGLLERCSDVVGVQGYIEQGERSRWREILHRVFGLYHLEPNSCRVLPSVSATYPSVLDEPVTCEWMSGSNQVYRREVLRQESWDELLWKYADGEDLDLSYRIHRRHPGKLLITPHAHVIHDEVTTSREVGRDLIMMREVYGWYLFNKLFAGSSTALIQYLWSRFGRLLLAVGVCAAGRRAGAWSEVSSIVSAYHYVFRNRSVIARGHLDGFNTQLIGANRQKV